MNKIDNKPSPHNIPSTPSTHTTTSTLPQKTLSKLQDPRLMDDVFSHLANGGSMVELCEMWGVRYSDIMRWINKDAERKSNYETAMVAQSEWAVARVLQEVQRVAFVDIRGAYDENGRLRDLKDMPEDVARAIGSIETVEYFEGEGKEREQVGWVRKVKMLDKLKGIEMLMKKLQMLVERVEHTGKITLEQLIEGSIKPVEAVTPEPEPEDGEVVEKEADEVGEDEL